MSAMQALIKDVIPTVTLAGSIEKYCQNKQQEVAANIFAGIPRRHKKHKPVSMGCYENSRLCRVYKLNMSDPVIRNIPRAGVVFYTFINDEMYMCFGRDQMSGDLTDFGGGRKKYETPVRCAIREGNEETRFAFSEINTDQVQGFLCLYSSNMLIIFVPVAPSNNEDVRRVTEENFAHKQFLNKRQSNARPYNEISEIVWLNESQIANLFSPLPSIQMFAKVRRFIYSCNEFSQNIARMKDILYSVISGHIEEVCSSQNDMITVKLH